MDNVLEAARMIQEHCRNTRCGDCIFRDDYYICRLHQSFSMHGFPDEWELPENNS